MSVEGQSYHFRGSGSGGPGAATDFAPDRTLFVAQAWPAGADPLVYFTAIDAAITQAIALTPGAGDPIIIVCYPGVYSEPLALASNVFLVGAGAPQSVTLDGNTSWTPIGAGDEFMALQNLRFSDNASLNVDTTGKGGGITQFDCDNVNVDCLISYLARAGGADQLRTSNGTHGVGQFSFEEVFVTAFAQKFNGPVRWRGGNSVMIGCVFFGNPLSVENAANVQLRASRVSVAINVSTGCSLSMPGSSLDSLLTVAAGGGADLRMCEFDTHANLAGAGEVDRSIWTPAGTVGPTAIGDNVVSIAPIMASTAYRVLLTQTAGTPGAVLVTAKAQANFTLNDAVGGNTFDIAILRE